MGAGRRPAVIDKSIAGVGCDVRFAGSIETLAINETAEMIELLRRGRTRARGRGVHPDCLMNDSGWSTGPEPPATSIARREAEADGGERGEVDCDVVLVRINRGGVWNVDR